MPSEMLDDWECKVISVRRNGVEMPTSSVEARAFIIDPRRGLAGQELLVKREDLPAAIPPQTDTTAENRPLA